jgi:NTE family protein
VNGFVLSGAANLGSIQVGMLKALLEAGIVPEVLVGTSIGAVNAAFLAADPTLDQTQALCELWTDVRARDIFPPNPWVIAKALYRQGSLFPSDSWRRYLEEILPYARIEDAAVPLRITATDFEEGTPVVLDSGPVVEAILASTALPSIFPPHRIGDRLYLDGALSEQVPMKPAIEAGADTVYVMAVSIPRPPPGRRSPGGILRHSLTILLFPRIRLDALDLPTRHPDLRIVQVPSVSTQVSLWDMSRHPELIARAYDEVVQFLAERGSEDPEDEHRAHVASIPETEIEAELQHAAGPESRSADTTDAGAEGRRGEG